MNQIGRIVNQVRSLRSRKIHHLDYTLLFAILSLIVFGMIMVYSSSSYVAQRDYHNSMFFLRKQIYATLLGMGFMAVTMLIDYQIYKKFYLIVYAIGLGLVVALLFFGTSSHGATRWIPLFAGFNIQPAEVAKTAMILYTSTQICRLGRKIDDIKYAMTIFIPTIVMVGAIFVISENMSSALIVVGIVFVMMAVASQNTKPYVLIMVCGFLIVGIFVIGITKFGWTLGFRSARILAWLDPEAYADGKGFQTTQALYAIGSGNYWGRGLGASMQKLGFIPEAQNDMIFSIICEELGLFGAFYVMSLFAIVIWRCVYIACNARDRFGSMLVVGVMSHLGIQVLLNIAVVTNTIPNTGISLPFISYGGSSVLFLMIEVGLVLNVSMRMEEKESVNGTRVRKKRKAMRDTDE